MPVSKAFAESNRSQTERMRRLVQRLNPAMLARFFIDRPVLACGSQRLGDSAIDVVDDRILDRRARIRRIHALESMSRDPPHLERTLDRLSVIVEGDAEVADGEVSDEAVEAALSRPDAPNLDRGSHREGHLDTIEKALSEAGYA